MAALEIPTTPSIGDTLVSGNREWRWNGVRWVSQPPLISPSRLSGEGAEIGDVLTFDGQNYSPVPLATATTARAAWDSPYHYFGTAPTGTAESATGWTITRLEISSDGTVASTLTATGAWSARTTLSYS